MEKCDITIIGAGVIGLATAYELSKQNKNIVVLEKNLSFGQETSSRNSEVIHAGLYYQPESLKVKTCIRGRKLLYEFCRKNNITHNKIGKLVIACNKEEVEKVINIYENALKGGVENLKLIEEEQIKKVEPAIKAQLAIFSPETGIVDTHSFMKTLYYQAKRTGVMFSFETEVIGIEKGNSEYNIQVKESSNEQFVFQSPIIINCAGNQSDKIARMAGIDTDKYGYKIHYCKGQYFRIGSTKKYPIKHLVYPPATPVSLGIHITPDLGGGLRLGPDAKYVSQINYNVDENQLTNFYDSVVKFLPELDKNDLKADTAGIRPKLQAAGEGFKDFIITEESDKGFPGLIDLIGIESPGFTGSLAISEIVAGLLTKTASKPA